jgi:hypothetical protein
VPLTAAPIDATFFIVLKTLFSHIYFRPFSLTAATQSAQSIVTFTTHIAGFPNTLVILKLSTAIFIK